MHGQGTKQYADGRIYKGLFAKDKFEGHGVMTLPDGTEYDCDWKYGKKHGLGYVTNKAGNKRKAQWENDELIREYETQ